MPTRKQDFLFLDLPVRVVSDSPDALRDFASVYRRFRVAPEDAVMGAGGEPQFAISIVTAGASGGPALLTGGERFELGGEGIPAQVYFFILNHVLREVEGFHILHGAALERHGRGVVLSGASAAGKTTLALRLAGRGFALLSDELAPIRRDPGLIEPFPRSVGVRRGGGEVKDLFDIGEIPGARLGTRCPPGHFFFLCSASAPEKAGARTLEVSFSRVGPRLTAALAALPGVLSADLLPGRTWPTVRIVADEVPLVERVEEIARRLRVFILQSHRGASAAPDYAAAPRIERLTGSFGVLEAARHSLNGRPQSRLLAGFGGSRAAMIADLAGLLGESSFYRLTVGRLDEMVDLVERTVG